MVSEGEKEKARRREGRGGNNNKEALSKKSPRAPRGGAQEIGRQMEMEREGRRGETDGTRTPPGTAQFVSCKTTGTG